MVALIQNVNLYSFPLFWRPAFDETVLLHRMVSGFSVQAWRFFGRCSSLRVRRDFISYDVFTD